MTDGANGEIQVVCRFRPLNDKELNISNAVCVDFLADKKTVSVPQEGLSPINFRLDHIFTPASSQTEVYQIAAQPIIESVMQGFNGTVLAYGQTSSGKTFTMTGPSFEDSRTMGIIPRMVGNVFEFITFSNENLEFTVKVSYCEIYMEKIRDLIDPTRANLKVHEDKMRGVYIGNLSESYVNTDQEVYELMKLGTSNREVGHTEMNHGSSRSHAIFVVSVTQTNVNSLSTKVGKLYLVDLAGSEKVGKTGASGKRLEEAKTINKSLTVLGQVISNLTDNKSTHIPYRDSKLTRVLQDSLGGNSRTSLIITCSPSIYNLEETISTLRFGVRAKSVKNKPKVNKEYTVAELKVLLARAQEEIEKKSKIIEVLQSEIKNSGGKIKNEATEPGEVLVSLEDLYEDLENLKEKLDIETENCEELRADVQKLESIKEEILLDNSSMVEELKSCHEELLTLKNDLAAKEEEILELKNSKQIHEQQIEQLNLTTIQLQQENKETAEELEKIKKDYKNHLADLEGLRQAKFQLISEREKTDSLSEQLRMAQNSINELTKQKVDIDKLRESLKKEIQLQEASKFYEEKQIINNDLQNRIRKVIELQLELDDKNETLRIIEERMSQGDKAIIKRNDLLSRNIEYITDLYYKLLNERTVMSHDNQVLIEKVKRLLERISSLEEIIKAKELNRFEDRSFIDVVGRTNNSGASRASRTSFAYGPNIKKPIRGGTKCV